MSYACFERIGWLVVMGPAALRDLPSELRLEGTSAGAQPVLCACVCGRERVSLLRVLREEHRRRDLVSCGCADALWRELRPWAEARRPLLIAEARKSHTLMRRAREEHEKFTHREHSRRLYAIAHRLREALARPSDLTPASLRELYQEMKQCTDT